MAVVKQQIKWASPRRSRNDAKSAFAFPRGQSFGATKAGFTIIEMLIVVAIFAVVATVLLFNYRDFSNNVSVRNLAEETGLAVRKSQSYATSIHSIAGTNGALSDTYPAYGVSFSVNTTGAQTYDPTVTSFALFADISPSNNTVTNNLYDNNGSCGSPSNGQECLESFGLKDLDTIVSLCTDVPSSNSCFTPQTGGTVNVVFHRPNPDAVICVVAPGNGGACSAQMASYLKVTVASVKGLQHVITIWNTGQISIN
jgi:prepilin-type N-terminal cleavage/methylation domain-containing protein